MTIYFINKSMRNYQRFFVTTSVGDIELTKGYYLSLMGRNNTSTFKKKIKKFVRKMQQKPTYHKINNVVRHKVNKIKEN